MEPVHIALLLLTLRSDGGVRMSLTETEDLAECASYAETIETILTSVGREIIAMRCGQNALHLTPFAHGTPEEAEIERYRVTLMADGAYVVDPLAPEDQCTPAPQGDPAVYCTRSAQKVITDTSLAARAPDRDQARQGRGETRLDNIRVKY